MAKSSDLGAAKERILGSFKFLTCSPRTETEILLLPRSKAFVFKNLFVDSKSATQTDTTPNGSEARLNRRLKSSWRSANARTVPLPITHSQTRPATDTSVLRPLGVALLRLELHCVVAWLRWHPTLPTTQHWLSSSYRPVD